MLVALKCSYSIKLLVLSERSKASPESSASLPVGQTGEAKRVSREQSERVDISSEISNNMVFQAFKLPLWRRISLIGQVLQS